MWAPYKYLLGQKMTIYKCAVVTSAILVKLFSLTQDGPFSLAASNKISVRSRPGGGGGEKMQHSVLIIQYDSNCIFGIMEIFCPKISPKNQPHISFKTVWQDWLGIAKPKNIFRLTLNPSNKL